MDNAIPVAGAPEARTSWFQEKILMGMTPARYLRSLVTPANAVWALILAVGLPVTVYRFWAGIGAVSNLTNTNPWGIWIGLDVASGVALAAGGFCTAGAVYIFGLEKYHPIVRPAILTGFLGYTFVVIGLLADLGQPWNLPVPMFKSYGVTSVLFEVAWCVALYATVLALEFSPAIFEWLGWKKARAIAVKLTIALTVFGIVLSTLHQSSLGSLFLMAKGKMHPLWYSPFIPIFFFVSAIAAGLSMVIFESSLSHRIFRSKLDPNKHVDLDDLMLGLAKAASVVLFSYFFCRMLGLIDSHAWHLLNTNWGYWFMTELAVFVLLPCFMYAFAVRNRNVTLARIASVITVIGIVVYRFNVSFITFRWDQPDRYVPHWMEVMVSVTIISIGILVFRWIVNRMPVLHEHPDFPDAH